MRLPTVITAMAFAVPMNVLAATPPDTVPPPAKDVTVVNAPLDVTVVNTSLPVYGEVEVTNDASNPVPITGSVEVIEGRKPYQEYFQESVLPGALEWRGASEPVPESRRLTVEFMTINYPLNTSVSELGSCQLYVLTAPDCDFSSGDTVMLQDVPTTSARRRGLVDDFLITSAAQEWRLFVEANQSICLICPIAEDNNLTGIGSAKVSIVGYLEAVD